MRNKQKVIAQYEAIRRSGLTNMWAKTVVQRLAAESQFHELVVAIDDGEYVNIIGNYDSLMKSIKEEDIPEVIV